ncbi:GTPase HflX [Anaerocolumna sp. AGMB13020]|uniref:GTPase HflX n=1 Tax=Anaerocolumna sp. AGMB13020 TaxID=3081750 RepID=UPI002954986C|nr:GTPase HflX [Anaerocolumna sp. AGMB13020]WOO38024.1 GTPase HflX [Anaerocolumna sp. AGMB13020]
MMNKEKVLLAGGKLKNDDNFQSSMEELKELTYACDMEVVGEVTQNLDRIHADIYFGKGKAEELKELFEEQEADLVVFNDELSPSQTRNLERFLGCRVVDRAVLIMDIFARRAKTREAQLQVEAARLKYLLPRLSGMGINMNRQGGGSGMHNKGTGETKLELDRRKIEERIARLERELEELVGRRQNQRQKREKNEVPLAALVGYTNAGKSTVMNGVLKLMGSAEEKLVLEKDMLFATLETSVRKVLTEDNKSFLLTDTVGFISRLPHHLIKAFRSTLEEVLTADLLVQVIDVSDKEHVREAEVTRKTLEELGAGNIPVLYVYNKADKLTDEEYRSIKSTFEEENSILLSAKSEEDLKRLIEVIAERLFKENVNINLRISYSDSKWVAYLKENTSVSSLDYAEDGIYITTNCSRAIYEKHFKDSEYMVTTD